MKANIIVPTPDVDKITELEDTTSPPITRKTNYIFAKCVPATGKIYGDSTGRFVATSISGNKYLLVIYDYDSNTIHAEGMPSNTKESQVTAYNTVIKLLQKRGCNPKLLKLDNVTSDFLEEFLDDEDITFELVPPYLHRRNSAERAIRTFKEHFIAILSGTDPSFPINLWDKLLPQAIMTLNLLRMSRINPQLSTYAQLWGAFNYNKHTDGSHGYQITYP